MTENRLLRALGTTALHDLLRGAELTHIAADQVLLRAGASPEYVYFPEAGIASVFCTSGGRAQVATGMVGHEGAVGITEALADGPSSSHVAVTIVGKFWKVSARACRSAFGSETPRQTLERYGQFILAEARQSVACATFHTVERRLARWLWTCWRRANVGNGFTVTHEYLAAMLGCRRASISEALGNLSAGGIETARGKITVCDPNRLANAACRCQGVVEALERAWLNTMDQTEAKVAPASLQSESALV